MQSSAAVVGRALIMLACVIGIPALALSGTSWSEMLKRLQDFQWPGVMDFANSSKSSTVHASAGSTARQPLRAVASASERARQPIAATATSLTDASAAFNVVPAAYQPEIKASPAAVVPATREGPIVGGRLANESFHAIQARLKQLGATYYLLESWGTDQQLYRFYCKMAIGGSPDYTRYFESTHADPLAAMQDVLKQVEAWQHAGTVK